MKAALKWFWKNGAGSGVSTFNFGGATQATGARGVRVNYNTTDFSYLSSDGSWTDTGSFKTGANVIDIFQVLSPHDNTKACAGVGYYQASDDQDLIVFGGFGSTGTGNDAGFLDRATLSLQFSTTGASQGVNIDSINSYIISWITGPNRIQIKDFSNTTIETLSIGTSLTQGMMAYNHYTGDLYLTPETSAGFVERWRKVAGAWALQETKWYTSIDGIAFDFLGNRIVNFPTSGSTCVLRYQSEDGYSRLKQFNMPLNPGSSFNTEGLVVDPRDGTIWFADPSGYIIHGNITDANRGWHVDPEKKYLKYLNAPHMVGLDKFKHDGSVTGQLNQQEITGATSVTWPIFDFTGFTNQQNASAWQDMDGTTLSNMEWRGSNTAPTTSPSTPVACSVPYYDANGTNDGWGSTTPGAWQSTPPANTYVQARTTAAQPAPADEITVAELIAGLNGKCKRLYLLFDEGYMYVDPSLNIINTPNQVNGTYSLSNTNFYPVWVSGSPGYFKDSTANGYVFGTSLADISSDQSGQVTVVARRDSTANRGIYFAVTQAASNGDRLIIGQKSSGDPQANEDFMEYWDGSGSVHTRVGVADASTSFKRRDYISTGSVYKIKIGGVDQVLNVSVGTNNHGAWIGDLTSPTRVSTGLALGAANVTGLHWSRLLIYCNAELDSTENALIDSFITQENLLA